MTRRKLLSRRPEHHLDNDHGDSLTSGEESYARSADSGDDFERDMDDARFGDEIDEAEFDDGIAQLYSDDSVALVRWKDRLSQYVDAQGTLDALRLRPASEQPWPAPDNPMLGYLIERSIEIAGDDGLGAAVGWLAANAWFEGSINERSRFMRLLDAD